MIKESPFGAGPCPSSQKEEDGKPPEPAGRQSLLGARAYPLTLTQPGCNKLRVSSGSFSL